MSKVKRQFIILLTVLLLFTLPACEKKPDDTQPSQPAASDGEKTKAVSDSVELKADDGTVVYRASVNYPEIILKEAPQIQDTINNELKKEADKLLKPEFDFAAEYGEYKAEGLDYFCCADYSMNGEVTRLDADFISVRFDMNIRNACAISDESAVCGATFSASDGNRLSLSDLAPEDEGFIPAVTESVINSLNKMKDSGELSSLSTDTAAELISSGDCGWYLTDSGLVITYASGSVCPAAFGAVEVPVASAEISDYLAI